MILAAQEPLIVQFTSRTTLRFGHHEPSASDRNSCKMRLFMRMHCIALANSTHFFLLRVSRNWPFQSSAISLLTRPPQSSLDILSGLIGVDFNSSQCSSKCRCLSSLNTTHNSPLLLRPKTRTPLLQPRNQHGDTLRTKISRRPQLIKIIREFLRSLSQIEFFKSFVGILLDRFAFWDRDGLVRYLDIL